jgi:RNA polymerase primary sigma factor
MDPQEEGALLQQMCAGSGSTGQRRLRNDLSGCVPVARLVAGYQPLITMLARRYERRCHLLTLLDLVQEGSVGLLEALRRYALPDSSEDEEIGARFRAWAVPWIRGAMLAVIRRSEGAIRLPARTLHAIARMGAARSELLAILGYEPTQQELADSLDVPVARVRELLALATLREPASLDGVTAKDGADGFVGASAIEDREEEGYSGLQRRVLEFVAALPDRARQMMALRYGFGRGASHTQQEVSELFGVARSTVEAIDRGVRLRLREALLRVPTPVRAAAA